MSFKDLLIQAKDGSHYAQEKIFFTVRCYSRKPVSMRSLMKISFRNSV